MKISAFGAPVFLPNKLAGTSLPLVKYAFLGTI
ncbi:expressed protein [Echinococcus multilocularis]|uniref:Expressed protein n=1 Tax=Echinococcus multilocularis TaxID=6211 RepID=A0A068Y8S9_ECHMU|nr:expressed protein [Echinococcus multilocularis]